MSTAQQVKPTYELIESSYSKSDDGLEGIHYFQDGSDTEIRIYTTNGLINDCISVYLPNSYWKEYRPTVKMVCEAQAEAMERLKEK